MEEGLIRNKGQIESTDKRTMGLAKIEKVMDCFLTERKPLRTVVEFFFERFSDGDVGKKFFLDIIRMPEDVFPFSTPVDDVVKGVNL